MFMTDKHNKQENLCTSSERTQNKCPYCKAAFKDDLGYGLRYDCRSVVYKKGKPKESGFCQGRQQARSELSKEIAKRLDGVIVGRFILRTMANGSIWVADKDSGEGGEFSVALLEEAIKGVYDANF